MALEGLNTNGAYPVYDTSGTVNMYAKLMQQNQARKAAEQKDWNDKLSKLNTKGLRPQDKDDYYKDFNTWKSLSQQAYNEKDPRKKFELQAQSEQAYNNASQLVYDSEEKTKRDAQIGMKILGKPHFFNQQGKEIYKRSLDAPVRSEYNISDYSTIPLGHDLDKVPDKIAKIADQIMQNNARYVSDTGTNDGKGTITFKRIRRGDPEKFASDLFTAINTQDDIEAFFETQYPDLDWDNANKEAKVAAVQDYVSKNKLEREEAPLLRNDPEYMSPYQRAQLSLSQQRLNNENNTDPNQVTIGPKAFRRANTKDPMKPGDVTLEFTSYGAVNPMDFDSSQLESIYDITAGKNTNAVAFKGGSITGVGYARAKGGKPRLMATLVDKDGYESAIDYKDIPLKQREDKFFKAVVGRLKKPQEAQSKTQKRFSSQQETLIEKNLKANPSYSREEIIQALGL